MRSNLKIKI